MATAKQMQAFVRVTIVPVTGSPILWQASIMPLPDPSTFYDGFKPGEIIYFNDVERALSDHSGAFEVSTFSFTVDDRRGFWRGLLADVNTQYLTSSDVAFLLTSAAGRAAASAPRPGFRGQLEHPTLLPDGKFQVGAQSRLGTRYGPVNLSGPVLKRTYNNVANGGDFPDETFPRDSQGKAVRFLWGEKTDAGRTNDNGDVISQGTMWCVDCGMQFQGSTSGTPPTSPTYLPDPPAPIVTPVGAGGSTTWTFAASVRTANGHTRLGATTTVDDLPSDGNWTGGESDDNATPTNGAIITLTPYASALMAEVTVTGGGADLWVKKGAADSTNKWNKVDAAGQMFNSTPNEYFNGPAGYQGNGDDHFHKGGKPPTTNTAQITPGAAGVAAQSIFYTFWGWLGHPGKITQIYGSDLAQEPAYGAIAASEIGVDYTDGKDFLLGPDGEGVVLTLGGKDYFGFFAKGPKDEAARTGPFPFRVNGCGWHEDNDTALPIIDQAALSYQDVFTQLSGNNGRGYEAGARLTIPTFVSDPTVPILQSTTFFETQDITKVFLGTDKGYLCCIDIDDLATTWGSFTQQMDSDFHFDLGENHQGQLILKVQDDTLLATDGDLYRQFTHILRVDDPGAVNDDEILNVIEWENDWHPIESKYQSGIQSINDPVSITKYGERKTSSPRQQRYVNDPATGRDAIARLLMDISTGPMYPAITLKQRKATQIELGDQIRIQHQDMVTEAPVPLYVRRYRHSFHGAYVHIVGRDRRGTYAQQVASDATTGTNYDDATADERLQFAFATDDDGLNSDGTLGARAR